MMKRDFNNVTLFSIYILLWEATICEISVPEDDVWEMT
jgi:hypothetical protein